MKPSDRLTQTQLSEDRAQLEAIREKAARRGVIDHPTEGRFVQVPGWADVRFLLDLIDLAATPGRWDEFLAVIGADDGR